MTTDSSRPSAPSPDEPFDISSPTHERTLDTHGPLATWALKDPPVPGSRGIAFDTAIPASADKGIPMHAPSMPRKLHHTRPLQETHAAVMAHRIFKQRVGQATVDSRGAQKLHMDHGLPVGNPLELEQQVCFALTIASRRVVALYRPLLEPLGLTHPQYLVMLALWEQQPLRVSELSERLHLDPATLSPLLKRLEASGYVRRERDPEDERALSVVLTDQGNALRNDALAIPPAVVERLDMEADELLDLHRRLQRIIEAAS